MLRGELCQKRMLEETLPSQFWDNLNIKRIMTEAVYLHTALNKMSKTITPCPQKEREECESLFLKNTS